MRRLCYCSDDGVNVLRYEVFSEETLVPTNVGSKRADLLQGCTKSSLVVPGFINALGNVTYTARHGGAGGNRIFVEHQTGSTGPEHASRPLAASADTNDEDGIRLVVTFGTTGGGFSIRPTAQQVVDAVNGSPTASALVTVVPGGTGDAGVIVPTYLTGGLDDGDWRKFTVHRGTCLRINTVEVV
jgi:hypothetical protein